MGRVRVKDILGFDSAPSIGSQYNHQNNCGCGIHDAQSLPLIPFEKIPDEGNFFKYRERGVHRILPTRPISAQTRIKNNLYEMPAATWTDNVEGPPWVVRVPGIPTQAIYMPTVNDYTTQPQFLSPIANLQMQNDTSWFGRLRAAVLGHVASQENPNASMAAMFPSIFDNGE